MNYYAFHIGDYFTAAAHLSWDEDHAYRLLLDLYYKHEAPLPAKTAQIARLLRITDKAHLRAIDNVLREFFTLTVDGWVNRRCEAEIAKASERRDAAAASANARWHKDGEAGARPAGGLRKAARAQSPEAPRAQSPEAPRASARGPVGKPPLPPAGGPVQEAAAGTLPDVLPAPGDAADALALDAPSPPIQAMPRQSGGNANALRSQSGRNAEAMPAQSGRNAAAMPSQCEGNAPNPNPNPKTNPNPKAASSAAGEARHHAPARSAAASAPAADAAGGDGDGAGVEGGQACGPQAPAASTAPLAGPGAMPIPDPPASLGDWHNFFVRAGFHPIHLARQNTRAAMLDWARRGVTQAHMREVIERARARPDQPTSPAYFAPMIEQDLAAAQGKAGPPFARLPGARAVAAIAQGAGPGAGASRRPSIEPI